MPTSRKVIKASRSAPFSKQGNTIKSSDIKIIKDPNEFYKKMEDTLSDINTKDKKMKKLLKN